MALDSWISFFDWRIYVTGFVLYLVYFYSNVLLSGLPRGPIPFPFVGNMPQLGAHMFISLLKLGQAYKDVFTVYTFSRPIVILNSYEAIKEAFVKKGNSTSGRPSNDCYRELTKLGKNGIIITDGPLWQEHRQFSLKVLTDLGMGRPVLERQIQEEAAILVSTVRSKTDQPIDPKRFLEAAISNIICSLLFGQRFAYDDPGFVMSLNAADEIFRYNQDMAPLNVMPWLKYLPGDMFAAKRIQAAVEKFNDWLMEQIRIKEQNYDDRNLDDFVTWFINQKQKLEKDGQKSTFTDLQRLITVQDYFFAGTETTTTTFLWGFLLIINNPDVLQKLHSEIDDVIGPHRPPSWKDRQNMPYTEAVFTEVLRMRPVGPLGVPHVTTEDIQIFGNLIPRGTLMLPNMHNVNHTEDFWEQPEKFDPERFLTDSGQEKAERVITFSMGTRVCPGEAMARMEIFLFLTTLLQSFTIQPPEGQQPPSTEGNLGHLMLTPVPYQLVFKERV